MAASVTFSNRDTSTQGSWINTYGANGYWYNNNPAYTSVDSGYSISVSGAGYTWTTGTDVRYVQRHNNPSQRIMSCNYNSFTLTIDVRSTVADQEFKVSIYSVDDGHSRRQTINAYPFSVGASSPGPLGASDNLNTSFYNGIWSVFDVVEGARFIVSKNSGANAIISFVAIDEPQPPISVIVPENRGIAYCPEIDSVFIINSEGTEIVVINPHSNQVKSRISGNGLTDVYFNPSSRRIYAISASEGFIYSINPRNLSVRSIQIPNLTRDKISYIPDIKRIVSFNEESVRTFT